MAGGERFEHRLDPHHAGVGARVLEVLTLAEFCNGAGYRFCSFSGLLRNSTPGAKPGVCDPGSIRARRLGAAIHAELAFRIRIQGYILEVDRRDLHASELLGAERRFATAALAAYQF